VASAEVSEQLTIRHLLTHTNGIDGEYFTDTGDDSNCIERYVRACSALGQVHAPGASTSYCNAAFVVLGGLVEHLTGKSWDSLLRERILAPLELRSTTTDYRELPRFRVAVGHVRDPATQQFGVSQRLHLPRGMGPTGATLHASAVDLAQFGAMFMRLGRTPGDVSILAPQTVAAALEAQAEWPTTHWTHTHMGLGWHLYRWADRLAFGHDGVTLGQAAFLRVMPDANLAVALLTNGGLARNLYHALYNDLFQKLAGTDLPAPPQPSGDLRFDVQRSVGSFANVFMQADVVAEGDELRLKTSLRQFQGVLHDQSFALSPISEDACRVIDPELQFPDILVFRDFDSADGRARCISLRHRDLPRVG
jgi:CubicO group peptidase (beta-lactamase class C family)